MLAFAQPQGEWLRGLQDLGRGKIFLRRKRRDPKALLGAIELLPLLIDAQPRGPQEAVLDPEEHKESLEAGGTTRLILIIIIRIFTPSNPRTVQCIVKRTQLMSS